MSWPCASRALWVLVLIVVVSADQWQQASSSRRISSISEDGPTRHSTIKRHAAGSDTANRRTLLSTVSEEQLPQVAAASRFSGSLRTLAAALNADENLVVHNETDKLLVTCGDGLNATLEEQAAGQAAARDMVAAAYAIDTLGSGPLASTASLSTALSLPDSISITEAFKLSSRPGSKFKIVLDFDGNTLVNSQWNQYQNLDKIVTGPYDKDSNPATFSAAEIIGECRSRKVW
eukprot:GHRQ01003109.1.p1 GENE.GHRQ01003109.1~~GHRQ01003109.1.p1  ORF type:complete len:233 (+),score=24.73 GHRQ01003109.1:120-818(+)